MVLQKKKYKFICGYCGKEYEVEMTENTYNKGKYKKFCSRKCANTRTHSVETKEKISNSVKKSEAYNNHLLTQKKISKNFIYDDATGLYRDIRKKVIYCGTIEMNNLYPEISKRQSPNWFNKLIPFGLDISKIGSECFVDEYFKCKELLYTEYVINKLSPADIYKKYGCSKYINNSETLLHVFKSWGFSTRGHSDAVKECFIQGKLNVPTSDKSFYKNGWHTTWNGKEVYYRSQYELDYAIELDNRMVDYDMECLRIKYYNTQTNSEACAIPDFYIPDQNLIVEIKSSYTLDIQNMRDKFKAYKKLGYSCKCICDYKEITI